MTQFELIDKLLWAAGFLAESMVFLAWCRSKIWRPVFMVGVYAGFRAAAEIAMFVIWRSAPQRYEATAWMIYGTGYILMALLAIQLSEVNRLNRRNLFFTFYCLTTTTAIVIGIAGILVPLVSTPALLRLARFADAVCVLNLLPALRRTMPRPYARVALVLMTLLVADFLCSQWQAMDEWHHWNIVSRAYSVTQLLGWLFLASVLYGARSHHYRSVLSVRRA